MFASRDIEDIIAVVDGRLGLETEIAAAPARVREYLAMELQALLDAPSFEEAVSGHLPGDSASQARIPLVLARLRTLAGFRAGGGSK
jgi:hypothetical protein